MNCIVFCCMEKCSVKNLRKILFLCSKGKIIAFFFFWSILPFSVRLIELKIYLAEHRNVSCVNDP